MPDEADYTQVVLREIYDPAHAQGLFGLTWDHSEPMLSTYMMWLSVKLIGEAHLVLAMRAIGALVSVVMLVPFYLLARARFSTWVAFNTTLLFSLSYWGLNFARTAWSNNHIMFFGLMALWLLERAWRTQKLRYYALAGVFTALCALGYPAGKVWVGLILAGLPIAAITGSVVLRKRGWLRLLAGYAILIAVALLVFWPQVQTIRDHWDLYTERTTTVNVLNTKLPYHERTTSEDVARYQLEKTLHAFVFFDDAGGNNRYQPQGDPFIDEITRVLFLCGLLVAGVLWRRMLIWLPLYGGGLVLSTLTIEPPDGARVLLILPAIYMVVGCALHLVEWLLTHFRTKPVLWALVALGIGGIALGNWARYVGWMEDPRTRAARQPVVYLSEIDLWRSRIIEHVSKSTGFLTVGAWRNERDNPANDPASDVSLKTRQEQVLRNPTDVGAHLDLSYSYGLRKNYQAAILEIQEVIRLRPNELSQYHRLGDLYLQVNQPDKALNAYREGLRLFPNVASAYLKYGIEMGKLGNLTEAKASLTRATQLDPKMTEAYLRMGEVLLKAGDRDGAIAAYEKAVAIGGANDGWGRDAATRLKDLKK